MNNVVLMGRLTRDPMISVSNTGTNIARYTLAVDRRFKQEGQPDADFISCVAFGKSAEFADKYLKQGTKICVSGRLQTGNYTNKDGVKVYTTDVIIDNQEFAESKKASEGSTNSAPKSTDSGFVNVPDGATEELPF